VDDKKKPGASPLNELSGPLRQAVEQVRKAPVPADALARALDKARAVTANSSTPPRRSFRWPLYGPLLGLAAAAVVMIAVDVSLSSRRGEAPNQFALNHEAGPTRAKAASQEAERVAGPAHGRAVGVGGRQLDDRLAPLSSAVDRSDSMGNGSDNKVPSAPPIQNETIQNRAIFTQHKSAAAPVRTESPPSAPSSTGEGREFDRSNARALDELAKGQAQGINTIKGEKVLMGPTPVGGAQLRARAVDGGGAIGGASVGVGGLPGGQRDIRILEGQRQNAREESARTKTGLGVRGVEKNTRAEPQLTQAKDGEQKQALESVANEEKKAPAAPRVWRRNGGRPSFARVYVGDGNALDLVSMDVHVTVEGPRARTVVDHVFRNPNGRQLEGTFEYPLPSGASLSYFAMFLGQTRETAPPLFVRRGGDNLPLPANALAALTPEQLVRNVDVGNWGRLQEARVVSKDKALETYEDVVRGRVDPALLEYASGNTFRGRVFPIAPKGYNRVVLAYEELLPVSQGKVLYRFPLPEQKLSTLRFALRAGVDECRDREFLPLGGTVEEGGGRVYYARNWNDEMPSDPEVLFSCTPRRSDVQSVSGRRGENGSTYVYARIRPELKELAAAKAGAAHAVFLLDTSLSEHADRFGVSMKLLQSILEGDPSIKQFNVIAFNAAATWVEPAAWLPNTPEGREILFKRLDGIVLEGATDVGAALDRLCEPPGGLSKTTPVECFLLSDGHATWGETEVATLASRFESRCPFVPRFHCYLTGLGAENTELFEALTRRGGGIFSCRGDADLATAAVAHRNQCLQVQNVRFVDGPAASDVLVAGRAAAVYPGGELVVAGRFQGSGRTKLVVDGTFAGERFVQEYPVEVKDGGELAPRGWAEIAVASLLALNDPKLDPLVTAYCQQFNIGSRVASFLVLENEADYKRFNLEQERGKTVSGDLGRFLDKMWESLAQVVSARESFLRFLDRVEERGNLLTGDARLRVRKLVSLMTDKEFEVPTASLAGAILHRRDVPPEYLNGRDTDRRDANTYLVEARRRASDGDVDGAVRVLSSICEEYPARGDALRLVGYRLLDLKQPGRAARLFERVQRQRPFEAHSYRDLARALEETGNIALAAAQYEIVIGSVWHNRFGSSLQLVAQEEYVRLMLDSLRRKAVGPALANYFDGRLGQMSNLQSNADLRVTISWNTDATDVDLWVIEPDGTKCFYQNAHTPSGGELSQDQTQGYGPERYQVAKALKGKYRVLVHYYNNNPNLIAGETHVNVVVTRFAGSPREVTERHTVVLRKKGEEVEVCDFGF
jgi:tetratricopeptide (TPR) repeat protein